MCSGIEYCVCARLTSLPTPLPRGKPFEKSLLHAVESVVIEWSHQIRDVLKKSSAQPLLEGKTPSPMVEIDFWNARRADLESIMDQVLNSRVFIFVQFHFHISVLG